MSEKLPAVPMVLLPSSIQTRTGEGIKVPYMPSDYPEESKTVRRVRKNAEKKIRPVLKALLDMEDRKVIQPGSYNAIIHVLTAVLVGKSAHDFSTKFWRLYGQVEAKWNIRGAESQRQLEHRMTERLQGAGVSRQDGFRDYTRDGNTRPVPLPVFVRNVLAHQGTNRNNHIVPEDIDTAIRLLEEWANE